MIIPNQSTSKLLLRMIYSYAYGGLARRCGDDVDLQTSLARLYTITHRVCLHPLSRKVPLIRCPSCNSKAKRTAGFSKEIGFLQSMSHSGTANELCPLRDRCIRNYVSLPYTITLDIIFVPAFIWPKLNINLLYLSMRSTALSYNQGSELGRVIEVLATIC